MPATPRRSRRFGGDAAHQRLMMANMAASLIAAEAIVTTEAKAKALRPVAEKLITKAKKGGLHRIRDIQAYLGDKEMTYKLVHEVGSALRRAPRWLHPHPQARVRATATTRPWPASSWSSRSHGGRSTFPG